VVTAAVKLIEIEIEIEAASPITLELQLCAVASNGQERA